MSLTAFHRLMKCANSFLMKMTPLISTLITLAIFVPLAACSEGIKVADEIDESTTSLPGDDIAPAVIVERAGKPVRIGEGGPRFDACQAVGVVTGVRGAGQLSVRSAPFDSADEKDKISNNTDVHICTRSHDQQWFGIVYAPQLADGEEELFECGVSSPVRSKRNYDGPCKSGWVESNFVKLIAG